MVLRRLHNRSYFHRFSRIASIVLGSLCLSFLLTSCGNSADSEGMSVSQLVQSFALYNENGEEAAAKDSRTGLSPFGAMVFAKGKKPRVFCSITHVAFSIVSMAGHCADSYRKFSPSDFYVFFYSNQTGKLIVTTLERDLYIGAQDHDDIAFFKIPDSPAKEWDVYAGGDFSRSIKRYAASEIDNNYEGNLEKEKPAVEDVTIHGFRPVSDPGMVYSPRHCKASRTMPWEAIVGSDGTPQKPQKFNPSNKDLDPSIRLFVDNCDGTTYGGFSGAAVTRTSDGKLLGVYDWNITKEAFGSAEMVYGNDRQWKKVWNGSPDEVKTASVFDFATVFDGVITKPGVKESLPLSFQVN